MCYIIIIVWLILQLYCSFEVVPTDLRCDEEYMYILYRILLPVTQISHSNKRNRPCIFLQRTALKWNNYLNLLYVSLVIIKEES